MAPCAYAADDVSARLLTPPPRLGPSWSCEGSACPGKATRHGPRLGDATWATCTLAWGAEPASARRNGERGQTGPHIRRRDRPGRRGRGDRAAASRLASDGERPGSAGAPRRAGPAPDLHAKCHPCAGHPGSGGGQPEPGMEARADARRAPAATGAAHGRCGRPRPVRRRYRARAGAAVTCARHACSGDRPGRPQSGRASPDEQRVAAQSLTLTLTLTLTLARRDRRSSTAGAAAAFACGNDVDDPRYRRCRRAAADGPLTCLGKRGSARRGPRLGIFQQERLRRGVFRGNRRTDELPVDDGLHGDGARSRQPPGDGVPEAVHREREIERAPLLVRVGRTELRHAVALRSRAPPASPGSAGPRRDSP